MGNANINRILTIVFLVLIGASSLYKIGAAWREKIGVHHTADEPVRILRAADIVRTDTILPLLQKVDTYIGIHPPLDWFYKISFLKIVSLFDSDLSWAIAYSQILAILTFSGLILFMFFELRKIANVLTGFTVTMCVLSSTILQIISVRAIGENTAILPYGLSLIFILKAMRFREKKMTYLVISGVFMLLASMARSEVVLLAPVMCLCLVAIFGWIPASVWGAFVGSYTVGKILYSNIFYPEAVQYTSAYKVWSYHKFTFFEFLRHDIIKKHLLLDYPFTFIVPALVLVLYFILKIEKRNLPYVKVILFPTLAMTLSVMGAGYLGYTHTSPSNLTFPFVGFYIAFGLALSDFLQTSNSKLQRSLITAALVIIPLTALGKTYVTVFERRKVIPSQVVDAKNWLREHASSYDGLMVDRFYYWEWYLQASMGDFFDFNETCNYGTCDIKDFKKLKVIQQEVAEFTPEFTPSLAEMNARAAVFLGEHKNPLIVLMNKKKAEWWNRKMRRPWSYSQFWYYDQGDYTFQFPGDSFRYKLRLLKTFREVSIFEIEEKIRL